MGARLNIAKAANGSSYIPDLGETFLYNCSGDTWELRVGDGKTPAKDLPHLYDLYHRLNKLEQEIETLKNQRNFK